ncbi:MAG: secretin and TonB N-terminal domain-containing protein [Thermodesulfobacteriota bacterium]
MRKAILSLTILLLAGCNITAFSKKKEEGLMPITQVVPHKDETLPQIELMPVAQVVEKMKEKEKLYNLSAQDMELREILFMFAEELPEYNIVIDPDVSGKVTVDFKELSLDNVLTILLEPLGLEYTIEDNILRVSKPRMVTRVFEFVYSTTNRTASTSLVAMTGGGGETSGGEGSGSSSTSFGSVSTEETIDVWGELESGISSLLSEAGKLSISKRIGRISVTDYRSNMKEIASFIDVFKRETKKQILIKAKILEIKLTEGSDFGIDWTAVLKGTNLFGGNGNPGSVAQSFAPSATALNAFSTFASPVTGIINRANLTATIKAMEVYGEVIVLSSPQVSTLNGQKAIIRSVTEDVIFQSTQSAGGGGDPISSTTAEPFTYGVFLDVTPHVDSEGMITMDIHPSVSSLSETKSVTSSTVTDAGVVTSSQVLASKPVINTREAETVATIKEGETVLIAGLMADDVQKNISKFPILGDIPYIKKLFRREIINTRKSELVILISPTIVGPRAKDFGNAREKYKMLSKLFSL